MQLILQHIIVPEAHNCKFNIQDNINIHASNSTTTTTTTTNDNSRT